ncbi:hypothetical protein [Paenibacillus sp. FSL K6-1230]|uniref:hypothetical protein n=1 Tax=Paenibacillus sp. FSL K6-1230 TaxID=2921603 RepID=UPI0030F6454B
MILTSQVSQYGQIVRAAPYAEPVTSITLSSNQKVNFKLDQNHNYIGTQYQDDIIKISTEADNTLSIEPLQEGSTFFNLNIFNQQSTLVQPFVVNVVDAGEDGIVDIGDIVSYLDIVPPTVAKDDVRNMLGNIDYRVISPTGNQAPLIMCQPLVTYNPNDDTFTPADLPVEYWFEDPNGDALSYAIVQEPSSQSGLNLDLQGSILNIGGTPTLPTTFTVRATDPQGLYADVEGKLDFVPEALRSHGAVQVSGPLTQVDLNEYFVDRDNEMLSFALGNMSHLSQSFTAWIEGDQLLLSGMIVQPMEIPVSAIDERGNTAYNKVELIGENQAPLIMCQPLVTYNPNDDTFTPADLPVEYWFEDPNGDALSYAIVQEPSSQSGLNLDLQGSILNIGGTPTLPTTFTVRATDPQGLYADVEGKLDFVPEALRSHGAVQVSGPLTQVDLNEYFVDRDNEMLSFALGNMSHLSQSFTAWIEGDQLLLSGMIVQPMEIPVSAIDERGNTAYNKVELIGENQTAVTLRQTTISIDPNEYVPLVDPNEDKLVEDSNENVSVEEGIVENEDPTVNTIVQESVPPSGQLSQVDLQAYFMHEGSEYHSYTLEDNASGEANAWIEENVLYISGEMPSSQVVAIRVEDEQGVSEVKYVQLPQTE